MNLPDWIELEHLCAQILNEQERHGWSFDQSKASSLEMGLNRQLRDAEEFLRRSHPYVPGQDFTPKRDNKRLGYVAGATSTRISEFNPRSRDHISWILQTFYEWKPTKLTPTGKPIIDEIVLKEINLPIAEKFLEILTISKMLGMLSQGNNAWLRLVKQGRIHHHCSVATTTHRCAHRSPNLAQVPADGRFRELFIATPGKVMVGADLSGIELRMLAHYLSRYDNGRYADILLNGDIHQTNADAMGISRREVKGVTYAFMYGAGNQKLGETFDDSLHSSAAKRKGSEIRRAFVDAIPGLDQLLKDIQRAADRGFIKSIDGRHIALESSHVALNYLLQSGAGVIAKRWMLINYEATKDIANQLAFIHDELQFETTKNNAQTLMTSLESSAAAAGEYYNMRCPIAAEAKTGDNWQQVH